MLAETECMAYELSHNYQDEKGGYISYKHEVTDVWNDKATGNGTHPADNTPQTARDAAHLICDVYENPDKKDEQFPLRENDAESLFNIMMGD